MYGILKKILSDNTKHKLFQFFIKLIKRKLIDVESRIPKYLLEERHFANLKALKNREKLLELMPKNAVVAELGVNKGDFSEQIINKCQPNKLHLVDVWNSKRYHSGLKLEIESKFEEEIQKGQIIINYGLSTDVVKNFENTYFDWIYIDTEHSYKCTIAELEMYAEKIKPGGIIAGHDYVMGNWAGLTRYGVIEAVYEFCHKHNWEIVFITMDLVEYQSFAIKKLN
jgi:hypothetical protein